MKGIVNRGSLFRALVPVVLIGLAAGSAVAEPARVGELEVVSLGTTHPYAATLDAPTEWTISWPGATYIRIHFSLFDLAPGDRVTLSSPDGSQSFTYTGRGPHGTGSFWANTILGDLATLRLQASVGGGDGFEVDTFGRGTEPILGGGVPQPESVCGTTDWADVECYRDTHPTEFERARGAVKALIGCCSACTAFKVSDSGQFMTNNHCTSSQSGVQSTELIFEYQNAACGGGGAGDTGSVMGSSLVSTDFTLDYTLMTTLGSSAAIPCLEIDDRLAPMDERIYIAGHPSAGVKKLSIESTYPANPDGLCEVDGSPVSGNGANTDIGYYCDTTNGSSGSPVLSGATHKVVAIHHFGGCLNSGVRMDLIMNQIRNRLDACSGGGVPGSEYACADGVDNDEDGLTDCDDPDCASDPACQSCLPVGSPCSSHGDCCDGAKCKGSKWGKFCT